jgi:hypothetical protein
MNLDPYTVQMLEIAGSWLSGIGTLAAVIVSLWLAHEERVVRLKVLAGHRLIMEAGKTGTKDYLVVSVKNVGFRPATITGFGWQIGFFRKQHCSQLPIPGCSLSTPLPATLTDGQEAKFFIPLDETTDWLENWREPFKGRFGKLRLWSMRVHVCTTVRPVNTRVEASLREQIAAHLEF